MKVKIKSNKLQVGRSTTVELLKPIRANGKPTHEFVYSKTLKTRLWTSGTLGRAAKEKLYEFWDGLEFFLQEDNPASRNRIIAQVEEIIPRLSDADFAVERARVERIAAANSEWLRSPEATKMRRQLDALTARELRLGK